MNQATNVIRSARKADITTHKLYNDKCSNCILEVHEDQTEEGWEGIVKGFYFTDETEWPVGPYKTFDEAMKAYEEYSP